MLLGEQEEHQAQQRGQRATAEVPFRYWSQQRAAHLAVQPGQLGDEQLDRLAHLVAQCRRDMRVLVGAAGEQAGQAGGRCPVG